jgi:uncharacterized damage-inducible protein DinB
MDVKDYLTHVYDYMYWANGRYLAVAAELTDEQLHRGLGHSWGDVHGTLVHTLSSERVWLSRWHGESPKGHLDPASFATIAALKSAWDTTEKEMRLFIGAQTAGSLQVIITYANFQGETFRVPLWQMLMHVANHETHHRGELAAMFALLNVPHPEDEVIQYFLNLSGQKKF